MRPRERREGGGQGLFQSRLEQILHNTHALVKVAARSHAALLVEKLGAVDNQEPAQPPLPTRTEAMKPSVLARVVIDTTVQPKAVMFPTDAKLLNRARERLVRLAKKLGVSLRQSYRRVGKLALIKHQRYAHAHQFKRANKSL